MFSRRIYNKKLIDLLIFFNFFNNNGKFNTDGALHILLIHCIMTCFFSPFWNNCLRYIIFFIFLEISANVHRQFVSLLPIWISTAQQKQGTTKTFLAIACFFHNPLVTLESYRQLLICQGFIISYNK